MWSDDHKALYYSHLSDKGSTTLTSYILVVCHHGSWSISESLNNIEQAHSVRYEETSMSAQCNLHYFSTLMREEEVLVRVLFRSHCMK